MQLLSDQDREAMMDDYPMGAGLSWEEMEVKYGTGKTSVLAESLQRLGY